MTRSEGTAVEEQNVDQRDVAVTVLGGYLGAGKTTLLNQILRSANERIVVLVNDFGSVNIDEELIAARSDDKITLANGCICCSLVDGLAAALEQVRSLEPRPARLVIEASGVADPASIAAYAHGRHLVLDGIVTVVDAETVRARSKDKYVGDTVLRQLSSADLLIVNKADLVDAAELSTLRGWLAEVCPGRAAIEAVQGNVPLDVLLGLEGGPRRVEEFELPSADSIFTPWSITVDDERFDRDALMKAVSTWPDSVVRVKGVVRSCAGAFDARTIVHRVGRRVTAVDDGPWMGGPSRLVAIGLGGQMDPDALTRSIRDTLRAPGPPTGLGGTATTNPNQPE